MTTLIYDGKEFRWVQADVLNHGEDAVTLEVHIPREDWEEAFQEGADEDDDA
jgi:hypothetical protein